MCKEAGGGGEGARDTESKTRTHTKLWGKNMLHGTVYVQENQHLTAS